MVNIICVLVSAINLLIMLILFRWERSRELETLKRQIRWQQKLLLQLYCKFSAENEIFDLE